MKLHKYAISRKCRAQFSEDIYAIVPWHYVAVHVKELFVPGIVASTLNKKPKGPHIVHLSTMCHLFLGQGAHFCLLIGPNNTHMVEDVEILLPVKFHWIPFSGFRGEVKNA